MPPVTDMDLRPGDEIAGGGVILGVIFRTDFFRKPYLQRELTISDMI